VDEHDERRRGAVEKAFDATGQLASFTYDNEGNPVEIHHINAERLPGREGGQQIRFAVRKRKPSQATNEESQKP